MAAQDYNSSYKSYKEGTERVATWLVINARLCGVEVETQRSYSPTKQPNRIKTGRSSGYTIALEDFKRLATGIANSGTPRIVLPRNVEDEILSVIAGRIDCRDKHQEEGTDDLGHTFVVKLFEEVLQILLRSRTGDDFEFGTSGVQHAWQKVEQYDTGPVDTKTNNLAFDRLAINSPNSPKRSAFVSKSPTPKEKAQRKKLKGNSYQFKPESKEGLEAEVIFALFTFWSEVRDIRLSVRHLWQDFKDRKIDACSASVATDTAFHKLQVMATDFSNPATMLTFQQMVSKLGAYAAEQNTRATKIDDWACQKATDVLEGFNKFLRSRDQRSWKDALASAKRDGHLKTTETVICVMLEFMKILLKGSTLPAEDRLSDNWREMFSENGSKSPPLHAVLSTQILFDIHDVLDQSASLPFFEFKCAGERVSGQIDQYLAFVHDDAKTEKWDASCDEMIDSGLSFSANWAMADAIGSISEEDFLRSKINVQEPFKLLRNHPVLAGLMAFRLKLVTNTLGIAVCHWWGSVICPAHLYNAVLKELKMDEKWDDMEYIVDTQIPENIFAGPVPGNLKQYWKSCCLARDTGITGFAENSRVPSSLSKHQVLDGERGLSAKSAVRDIFQGRYEDENGSADISIDKVLAMLKDTSNKHGSSTTRVELMELHDKIEQKREYSAAELLVAVREGIESELLQLSFDYFGFHERSWKLINEICRRTGAEEVEDDRGNRHITDESDKVRVVSMILSELKNDEELLNVAGKVYAEFLAKGEGNVGIEEAEASIQETRSHAILAMETGVIDSLESHTQQTNDL